MKQPKFLEMPTPEQVLKSPAYGPQGEYYKKLLAITQFMNNELLMAKVYDGTNWGVTVKFELDANEREQLKTDLADSGWYLIDYRRSVRWTEGHYPVNDIILVLSDKPTNNYTHLPVREAMKAILNDHADNEKAYITNRVRMSYNAVTQTEMSMVCMTIDDYVNNEANYYWHNDHIFLFDREGGFCADGKYKPTSEFTEDEQKAFKRLVDRYTEYETAPHPSV